MPRIEVYVDGSEETLEEGGYLAHVPTLPGCVARAADRDTAIGAYHGMLRANDLPAPPPDEELELVVIDTVDLTLPTDRKPMDAASLVRTDALSDLSRRVLRAVLDAMPTEALDWRADEQSWTPRNILAHMAGADLWYASRLHGGGLPELLWRLEASRALLLDQLRVASATDAGAVQVHMGEEWTPRKVARRLLEHEHEHTEHLLAILEAYRAAK